MFEIKILLCWLVLFSITYVIAKVHYAAGNMPWNWQYFQREIWSGILFSMIKWMGIFGLGLYGVLKLIQLLLS